MAYIYQITFDLLHDEDMQLLIGESVEMAVSYMKALLPNEPGYITSRGMFSLSHDNLTHVVFESTWEEWDDLLNHRQTSPLDEHRLLNEFKLKVKLENLATHVFEEVS
jgi:hypothetical protein